MKLFRGSAVALITPFKDDVIDVETFKQLINWHIDAGTQALIITGTTGESATLSKDEKLMLYRIAVETAENRVPVIANTGTNNTAESIVLSREAEALGVNALLVVTPYYNKPDQNGLKAHFSAIAKSVSVPIILYNVPSRTGVNLEVKTLQTLANEENIVGIKEAAADLEQIKAMIASTPDDFALYSGNDDLFYDTLALGGDGVISVVANVVPQDNQALYETFQTNPKSAEEAQQRLNILNDVLFISPNPVPAKAALKSIGFTVGDVRLPLTTMPEDNLKKLHDALNAYGVKNS